LVTAQLCVALLVTPTHHASGLARTSRLRRLAPVLVQKPPQLVPELTEANTTLLRLNDMVAAEDRPSPLLILWRFSRPHTIIGSAMCIPALMLYTAPVGAPLGPLVLAMLYAIPPSLLMNLYIVGVNQLTDIDLDKVNKPQLPLAAGVLSPAAGVAIVVIALFASLALGCHPWLSSGPLRATLIGSALLGTCYSLPPFRLKRYPLLAALSIMSVRGGLMNWGFCAHASAILSRVRTSVEGSSGVMAAAGGAAAAGMPLRCFAPIAFFVIFGTVIALVKDVPDVQGDAQFGIRSFSVRLGPSAVLRFAVSLLVANFAAAALALTFTACCSTSALDVVRRGGVALGAAASVWMIQRRATPVVPSDSASVYSFYMYLWRYFYAAYAWLPLAR